MKKVVIFIVVTLLAIFMGTCPMAFANNMENLNSRGSPLNLDHGLLNVAERVSGFGGMFFDDNGELNVYIVGIEQLNPEELRTQQVQVKSVVTDIFGEDFLARGRDRRFDSQKPESFSRIKIINGDYDFVQLFKWRTNIERILNMPGVVFSDLDESQNRLKIGVESLEMRKQIEITLPKLGVPPEAVIIVETEPIEFFAALRDRQRPVQGGVQVESDTGVFGYKLCTTGFNAHRSGRRGFVTNSHCTETQGGSEDTDFHQPDDPLFSEGNKIGDEIADPTYFTGGICPSDKRCRFSDSAFVEYDSSSLRGEGITRTTGWNNGSITINSSNPSFRIIGEIPIPIIGTELDKVGRTTGWTYGHLGETCININVAGSNIRMLCQNRVNKLSSTSQAISQSGDSGSPVFFWRGNEVELAGILWGGPSSGSGSSFLFSSMEKIEDELGSLQTFNFPPPPPPPPCPIGQKCCGAIIDNTCVGQCWPEDNPCP